MFPIRGEEKLRVYLNISINNMNYKVPWDVSLILGREGGDRGHTVPLISSHRHRGSPHTL
jgi:hypothetical protein